MFFHSTSVNPPWTQVLVGCLGNEHMTILRAVVVRERRSERSKGKSHKDPLVNLIKCDENQRLRLCDACYSREREKVVLFSESAEKS